MRNISGVLFANRLALSVGVGVVVAVGKAEATCCDEGDDLIGVAEILARAGVEEKVAHIFMVQRRNQSGERLPVRQGVDAGKQGFDRVVTVSVDASLVKAGAKLGAALWWTGGRPRA